MRQRGILGRSLGWLTVVAATLVIMAAVVVGIARLLLPLAPDYQDEIRRFVTEATGFDVRFGALRASWPLPGPEIRFSNVRVTVPEDQRQLLEARDLTVGIDLWRVIADRRVRPGRIAVEGASVRAERLPSGEWEINGVPLDELLRRPREPELPRLGLKLRDIDLLLLDTSRLEPRVALDVRELDVEVTPETASFEAELEGREGLGSRIEADGMVPMALLPSGTTSVRPATGLELDWEIQASGTDLDVARWLRVVANEPLPLVGGRGDLELRASFHGRKPTSAAVDLDLGPTGWAGVPAAANDFRRLQLQAAWSRSGSGWTATLERFRAERATGNSPVGSGSISYARTQDDIASVEANATALRLQDLWPMLWSTASTGLRRDFLPERLQGEITDLRVRATLPAHGTPEWTAAGSVSGLGLVMPEPGWGVTGVTGTVRSDQSGGQIRLDSAGGLLRFPRLFRADIRTSRATGQLGWKRTERGFAILGDDLVVATADGEGRARFQVDFPRGSPVFIDLAARFVATSAPAALDYLPLVKLKPNVVEWLDRALVAGSVPAAEVLWQGPVRGFPYEHGDGRFRAELVVADAVLDYADKWPRLENASGTLIVDRTSLRSVENRGSIGGIPFADAEIHVANLKDAELDVAAVDQVQLGQIFNFLRQTPVASVLGPTLDTATGSGDVTASIDLRLPIRRPRDYRLDGAFDLDGARLGLRGVEFGLTALDGTVRLATDRLAAERISGRFLDEPVTIDLRPARADEPTLSQVAELSGLTPAGKLAAAFSLPYADMLAGIVGWDATVRVPARRGEQPVTIGITSNLKQLVSILPEPLVKPGGSEEPLRMEVRLPERGIAEVSGRIDRGLSWALKFVSGSPAASVDPRQPRAVWRLERGSLQNGRGAAALPPEPGLEIHGDFDSLRFEDWFSGQGGRAGAGGDGLIRRISLTAERFAAAGRVFPDATIDATRLAGAWRVAVRGPAAKGSLVVPLGENPDAPVILDMERLWLVEPDTAGGDRESDPRNLPAIRATVADFVLGDMRLGRLTAEIAQRGDGVVVEPLRLEGRTFQVTGDATWVVEGNDVGRQRSELRLRLVSSDISPTLAALGYEPVVEGDTGKVTLDLFWPGGPGNDFLNIAGGRVVLDLDKGRLLPVDPGGGRLLGLLSIATLPRRLGLDFSDLVDEGLAFDEVQGEFRLDKGNAFTCNLGLEGPATDIGILGRASLRDRQYDQLAVVRPHVSDVLAVGGFVGGPVVGSTVLLISQIFRKPLSALGESYYRVSGNWDQPVVTKVQKSEVDLTPFRDCERYLAEALRELPPEAGVTR